MKSIEMNYSGNNLEQYIPNTIGVGIETHRARSEKEGRPIDLENARKATLEMKTRLSSVFRGISQDGIQIPYWASLEEITIQYQEEILRIPYNDPFVDKNRSLNDYLQVKTNKSPNAIKNELLKMHELGSIPYTFIMIMNAYEASFQIAPQDAAEMSLRYVDSCRNELHEMTIAIQEKELISVQDATRKAFAILAIDIDQHIRTVQEVMEIDGLNITQAHGKVILERNKSKERDSNPTISMSSNDKDGLVEAYHIQDRPYTHDELKVAERLLEENRYISPMMIVFQKLFIEHAFNYLKQHPERMTENLQPYNPIFVVTRDNNNDVNAYFSNPKLLKTISQNWIPAVGRVLLQDHPNKQWEDIDVTQLSSTQIERAITLTKEYSLFSSVLCKFVAIQGTDLVEWQGIFPQVCPAKDMFFNTGKQLLPALYEYLQQMDK